MWSFPGIGASFLPASVSRVKRRRAMFNPTPPTHDPLTNVPEADAREAESGHRDQAATNLGYLPASAQRFDRLTLDQWIDLCA
jgi:hypothetical protein